MFLFCETPQPRKRRRNTTHGIHRVFPIAIVYVIMTLMLVVARTRAFPRAASLGCHRPILRTSVPRTNTRWSRATTLRPSTSVLQWGPTTLSSACKSHRTPLRAASSSSKSKTSKAKTAASKTSASKPSSLRPYRLVIVESPNKCATIAKILNQYAADNNLPYEYQVTSCMGHIRNLPQKKERAPRKKKSATPTANATTADNNVVVSKFPYKVTGIDLDHNYTPTYVILEGKQQLVRDLTKLAHAAEMVCLATDPDREGEAMAWHLMQVLQLPDNMYQRITFSELTQSSIVSAVEHPVQLNTNLVHAQETRRILDRLAGFTVSPILWKKIAPGLSAGRVQSVGMALTVRRERERLVFEETEYWDLQAVLQSGEASDNSPTVTAMLQSVNGTALANVGKDFASQGRCLKPEARHKLHLDQERADDMAQLLRDDQTTWKVLQVQSRQRKQQSPLPYRTSTLQQEANRRLGMPIQQIMRTAQQLYEQGLISYMRTDSSHLSTEAQTAIGKAVRSQFGPDMIAAPDVSGGGKKKKEDSKFAQEAHEAIRPAIQSNGGFLQPEMISEKAAGLSEQAKSLYRLIYQRTLAHRMPSLVTNQTKVVIEGISADETINVQFRVSGSVVVEPGYTMVYGQTKFDEEGDEPVLPPLAEGQSLKLQELLALGHQTQPPPRYTEASFVKELEALGVGRPSTYAGVVQILRDRAYVGNPIKDDRGPRKSTKAVSGPAISAQRAAGGEEFTGGGNARGPLVPSLSAFVVCSLFEKHCPTYVDPSFTAQMEGRLDLIASGDESSEVQRIAYLDEFYAGDNGLAAQIKRIEDNVSADEARRASLPSLGRKNTTAIEDEVALFIGPWGPYVQKTSRSDDGSEKPPTASLPPGLAADISKITPRTLNAVLWSKESGGLLLGTHPDDGRDIRLKTGRFGAYLQWGEDEKDGTTTHSLPRDKAAMRSIESFAEDDDADSERMSLSGLLGISLEEAIGYVGLPRRVTTLNELPVVAAIGPYGPYLKYNSTFLSLNQKDGDVLSIDADTAERLVTDGIINAKDKKARGVVAEIGERDDSMVTVKDGRFGVYINWKNVNAKLPFNYASNPSELPLDEAWTLIQHKASSAPTSKGGRKSKKSCKTKDVLDDLPPVPKRPLSAYLHFCAAKRPEVSSKIKKLGDISKKLAELWGATSTEDRKEYDAAAAVGKANYEKAKKAWKVDCQTIPEGTKSGGRKGVKSKKASAPSKTPRAPNAYILFCREHRHTIVDQDGVKLPLGETTKRLAALWNVCDEETRAQFQQQASEEKEKLFVSS